MMPSRPYSTLHAVFFGAALLAAGMLAAPAEATVTTYTSSTAFGAAAAGITLTTENYGSGTAGQTIASGGTFDGLTYSFAAGPGGTLTGGIISNQFNSFSGLSLGGNQSGGTQFFFGGDSVTIAFSSPVNAFGAFFNVNANSGNYLADSAAGTATTGSAAYDTSTFVFAGLISDTAFSSITLSSSDTVLGSYNVPEIEFGASPAATVPEPLTLSLFGAGVLGLATARRRRKN